MQQVNYPRQESTIHKQKIDAPVVIKKEHFFNCDKKLDTGSGSFHFSRVDVSSSNNCKWSLNLPKASVKTF